MKTRLALIAFLEALLLPTASLAFQLFETSGNHLAAPFVEKAGADDLFERYSVSCATQQT